MDSSIQSLAVDLQRSLWIWGEDFKPSAPLPRGVAAAMVIRMERLKLKMYQERGHSLPHLHIDYGKDHHVASYSIDPVARLEGTLQRRYDYPVSHWIESHKDKLLELWGTLQGGGTPELLIAELQGSEA
jgi:hypothetical protein